MQTKKETIAEISSTVTKTIEQAVREKRALPQECLDKTSDERLKRFKSSTIHEFKSKGNKTHYEANTKFSEKLMMIFIPLKKGNIWG